MKNLVNLYEIKVERHRKGGRSINYMLVMATDLPAIWEGIYEPESISSIDYRLIVNGAAMANYTYRVASEPLIVSIYRNTDRNW